MRSAVMRRIRIPIAVAGISAALLLLSLAGCRGGSDGGFPEPTLPTPSTSTTTLASSIIPTSVEPTWCETRKFVDHHLQVDDIPTHVGDPRASNPDWVYLEVLADTFAMAGPEIPVGDLDREIIQGSLDWVPDTRDGVVGVLRTDQGLEYRAFDPSFEGYVMSLIPLEAEICRVGDRLTSTFAFVAGDTPGILASLRIEASVDGIVMDRTEPIGIEVAPTTSPQEPSATGTATREFRFSVVPPEGTFYNVETLPQSVFGYVRPQAQVTLNGLDLVVHLFDNPGEPPDLYQWSTWQAGDTGLLDIALEEGPNVLVFEAVFTDGSTMRLERTVDYDPALQRSTGYIVDATLDPPTVTIELATLEYGEFGIEQTSEDATIAEFPVKDDALFVVIGGFPPGTEAHFWQGLDLDALVDLAETAAGGDPLEGHMWRAIFPADDFPPAPWEFLITPEGQLQQATQFYSP